MFEDLFNASESSQFGSMGLDQAEDLVKTFTAGHANGVAAPGSLTGGAALQMESVDGTLKSVTLSKRHLVMWPTIPQDRAYSLNEQYNRTNSYGDNGSPYIPESGSPAMNNSNYDRHSQKVVFFSTRRGTSIASQFVRMNGNLSAEALEAQAGTMWLLEKLERELYQGQNDYSNAGDFDGSLGAVPAKIQNLALSGIEQQIRQGDQDYTAQIAAFDGYGGNDSVIRSVGDVLDEVVIEEHATLLSEQAGYPGSLDLDPKTMSDFVKQFFPKERVNALGTQDGRAGYVVRTLATTAGDIAMRPSLFLKPKKAPKANPDRSGLVPGAPATLTDSGSGDVSAGGGGTIDQASGGFLQDTDVRTYTVTACNEQGESNSAIVSKSVTVSGATQKVSFKIGDPSSGPTPTHYAVYATSTKEGKATPEFIGYVKRSGATTTFTDKGNRLAGSAKAYMMDVRPETIVWRQLAPMLRISQGTLGTAREFLLWLAGTLVMTGPRFSGVLENITRSA